MIRAVTSRTVSCNPFQGPNFPLIVNGNSSMEDPVISRKPQEHAVILRTRAWYYSGQGFNIVFDCESRSVIKTMSPGKSMFFFNWKIFLPFFFLNAYFENSLKRNHMLQNKASFWGDPLGMGWVFVHCWDSQNLHERSLFKMNRHIVWSAHVFLQIKKYSEKTLPQEIKFGTNLA